ncbi:MAG TPA: NB-ARC domain-containing protein [Ktedonobacteraceae bacterium]|nr:NB-ARC domain-containing protein [Ktedonobacteraceae bacterium]
MKSDLLRAERIQHGWSQAKLAEELGVDSRTVRRWERGQAVPFPYYRQKLSTLFGKTPEQLGLPSDIDEENAIEQVAQTTTPDTPASTSFLADPAIPQTLGSTNSLLGRNDLFMQVKQCLLAADNLASTALYGLPGSGKTALAAALATNQQVQAHFSNGVLWATLGQHPNVLGQLARWGKLLGVAPTQVENIKSVEAWSQVLRDTIGPRRFLLVIDDAWKAEDALALQIGGAQCSYLLTTRLFQNAFAFTFSEPQSILVPPLEKTDGLALLARFVPQLVKHYPKEAQALVQALEGLPLALTLMGNYLAFQASIGQHQPLQAALSELHETKLRLHATVPSTPGERSSNLGEPMPLSLQAAMDLSDQLLSPQAHAIPYTLAAFPPMSSSSSEDEALMVSQQPIESLESDLLEDSEPEYHNLHQRAANYAPTQSNVLTTQEQPVRSLVGYVQAHQHATYASGNHLLSFRSLWDLRIHMKSGSSSRPSNRSSWYPLLIISTILAWVLLIITVLPAFHQQHSPTPGITHVPDTYKFSSYTLTIPVVDPSLQDTAQHLQQTFKAVYPQLVNRFALDPATAPRNVTLTFSSNLSSPGAASDTTITLNANWMRQHPTDVGLLTHELTLVVQQYRSGVPAWFSEGMANYARYEYGSADDDWSLPDAVQPQDSYKQGGGIAARFLVWLEQYTSLDIVDQINHALQTKQSFASAFHRLTHHTVDELWNQYMGYPVIMLLPEQLYKTVTSRKPLYQSSLLSVQNSTSGTFNPSPIPDLYLSNFAIQADMTIVHGGGGGFVFRFNSDHFTGDRLRVSPDGSYDIVNQNKSLVSGYSLAFKQGLKQSNRLTIIVQKHTIYFYINNQFITQVDDSSLNYGAVGVLALDWGEAADVRFENMKIF